LDAITTVYSHPQALGQCRKFLEKQGVRLISTFDTAGSVKMIQENKLIDAGAIASERAAQLYGMKSIAKEIGDSPHNYTRFFVLSKHDADYTGQDKTSIIFSVKNVPGALYHVLEEFTIRDVNLTKIESRPTKQKPWEYNFYIDFKGHRSQQRCLEALKAVQQKALFLRILGSYKAAPGWF
jgi:chorismate mutase/prephenate dehydratase